MMDISILLAKFWGTLLVIFGILFLVRKKALDDIFNLTKDKTFVILSGYLALVLGLITVILHNTLQKWIKALKTSRFSSKSYWSSQPLGASLIWMGY